jgi:hypothetical protein
MTRAKFNRWTELINSRLDLDRKLTNSRYGKKTVSKKLVKATWKGILQNEKALPENWITDNGVLVGIE